jgi:hypothetical protein
MLRGSLIAVLLATQLLSWSAAPIFVCMANDGSIEVTLGEEHCACHSHHHGPVGVPHRHGPIVKADAHATCDCTHIQVSQQQNPTIVSKSTALDHQLTALVAPDCNIAINLTHAANALHLQAAILECRSLSLAQFETVALRC